MMSVENKKSYKLNEEKNEITGFKDFLMWYRKKIYDEGYNTNFKIDEIQELVDKIANWYEMKFPERDIDKINGARHTSFENVKSLSDEMGMEQLLYRLSPKQLSFIKGNYRANVGFNNSNIYENNKPEMRLALKIKVNHSDIGELPFFYVCADYETGEIYNIEEVEEFIGNNIGRLNLEELLNILNSKYANDFDFTELMMCVYNHNTDIKLRNIILQLVAFKLLYSKNSNYEYGYYRAKKYINEFNNYFNNILSNKEIDQTYLIEKAKRTYNEVERITKMNQEIINEENLIEKAKQAYDYADGIQKANRR